MNEKELEKYSSAITLSDMEIFVFPELMYSLVLANIMSPILWKWLKTDTFKKYANKTPYRTLQRMKQYVMDEYEFNLDLETWGLTNQKTELKRFRDFISPEDIANSNALFGYHGDEYYFDVDIRRHFGLDKYDSDIIPYWKTETVEAMTAFHHKPDFRKGGGECVSLAALYAAAAFIVCKIPLEDIYMILTPLHSQNYIDVNDGVLTNNRRIVTKSMWFNGSEISYKAQRALRNEQVTIVAHPTGWIHCFYDEATIEPKAYDEFIDKLHDFNDCELNLFTFANFLRFKSKYHKYFQYCCENVRGGPKFIKAETLYAYEHDSTYRIASPTYDKLIEEVSDEDIMPYKLPERMCCKQFIDFIEYENIDIKTDEGKARAKEYLKPVVKEIDDFLDELVDFLLIKPKLPSREKKFNDTQNIKIDPNWSREKIIEYLSSIRDKNTTADLAFYVYRDMENSSWKPFVKAAVERNPVSIEMTDSMSEDQAYDWLNRMKAESIYGKKRLAQPDEVANFNTGDGLEKAFFMANILKKRNPEQEVSIRVDNDEVTVSQQKEYKFSSEKGLQKEIKI